eukprot:CAMPEP_0168478040 /NCGR_PEP_ID=MMETSP0228-20121227/62733_1 /TAXON_ID=133427 /ORGANISM="Protoceratium reticulatum, Strain CCCM 535 (=CCMP 1889)" /LENGTH=67 /DNA_ID=CAMNT_0008494249 /DNA_START=8 /DNA_END=207 /DNA_ORIENTATION=+
MERAQELPLTIKASAEATSRKFRQFHAAYSTGGKRHTSHPRHGAFSTTCTLRFGASPLPRAHALPPS